MKHDANPAASALRWPWPRAAREARVLAMRQSVPSGPNPLTPAPTAARTTGTRLAATCWLTLALAVSGAVRGDDSGQDRAGAGAAMTTGGMQRGLGGLIGLDPATSLLTVTEGVDTDAIIAVVRGGTNVGAISAGFATQAGTASAGTDFGMRNGVAAFPNGDGSPRLIVVPILDDTVAEGPEQFTVSLSQPMGGAVLGPIATVTITILDNDVALPPDPVFASGFEG